MIKIQWGIFSRSDIAKETVSELKDTVKKIIWNGAQKKRVRKMKEV